MLSRQFNAAIAISHFDVAALGPAVHEQTMPCVTRACASWPSACAMATTASSSCHPRSLPRRGGRRHPRAEVKVTSTSCAPSPYTRSCTPGIGRNDYRGAASVLLDRIQKLRHAGEEHAPRRGRPHTPVTKQYLLLINALSCLVPKQAWVFSEELRRQTGAARTLWGAQGRHAGRREEAIPGRAGQDHGDPKNQFGFEADDNMELL